MSQPPHPTWDVALMHPICTLLFGDMFPAPFAVIYLYVCVCTRLELLILSNLEGMHHKYKFPRQPRS